MALITPKEFCERFDIATDIEPNRIAPAIGSASRRLRKWVGDTNYANGGLEAAEYEDLQADLKNAEAHLAYHYAMIGLNYPMGSKGILATAASGEGGELRKYLTPDQVAQVQIQFLEAAREIAEPYMDADGSPKIGFEYVEDE
ncbi:MAG: hypothetical protein IPN69_08245 [Acidobacteria bacterium]|nr:hypothetical protein [Acidobacteriota bacterium]